MTGKTSYAFSSASHSSQGGTLVPIGEEVVPKFKGNFRVCIRATDASLEPPSDRKHWAVLFPGHIVPGYNEVDHSHSFSEAAPYLAYASRPPPILKFLFPVLFLAHAATGLRHF